MNVLTGRVAKQFGRLDTTLNVAEIIDATFEKWQNSPILR
jgi:hypothetical protein